MCDNAPRNPGRVSTQFRRGICLLQNVFEAHVPLLQGCAFTVDSVLVYKVYAELMQIGKLAKEGGHFGSNVTLLRSGKSCFQNRREKSPSIAFAAPCVSTQTLARSPIRLPGGLHAGWVSFGVIVVPGRGMGAGFYCSEFACQSCQKPSFLINFANCANQKINNLRRIRVDGSNESLFLRSIY